MANYTLKVRRFQPESGEGPYWETFDVDLDPTLSVLDGLLQAKDRDDGSLAVRCSCRAAICGSCGMKINGQSGLACKTQIGEAQRVGQPREQRTASTEPIVVEPMGNMPVAQGPRHRHGVDALDQDPPRHPVAAARGRPARARVHRPARVDDRRDPVDGLHPVRRLRQRLPLDGGRPRLHRPGRARQGLPLRRRPARRRDQGAPARPRQRPARHLRLHPLLHLHRRLPQGRRADGPDHAPAPQAAGDDEIDDDNNGHRHEHAFVKIIEKKGTLDESLLLQESYAPGVKGKLMPPRGAIKGLLESIPTAIRGIRTGKMRSLPKLIPGIHPKLPDDAQDHVKKIYAHAEEHKIELNLYIKGEEADEDAPVAEEEAVPTATSSPSPTRPRPPTAEGEPGPGGAADERHQGRLLARLRLAAASPPSCTARWRWSPSGSGSSWSSSTAPTARAPA